jgi:hypothetical protein
VPSSPRKKAGTAAKPKQPKLYTLQVFLIGGPMTEEFAGKTSIHAAKRATRYQDTSFRSHLPPPRRIPSGVSRAIPAPGFSRHSFAGGDL